MRATRADCDLVPQAVFQRVGTSRRATQRLRDQRDTDVMGQPESEARTLPAPPKGIQDRNHAPSMRQITERITVFLAEVAGLLARERQ